MKHKPRQLKKDAQHLADELSAHMDSFSPEELHNNTHNGHRSMAIFKFLNKHLRSEALLLIRKT